MKNQIITEDEQYISYLIQENDSFKKYAIVSKKEDLVEISCKDKTTNQIYSVYLRKIDIKNLYDTLRG